jgi:cytochrome c biogenesis protein CcmG, thiol:disulfide interchange protein DsbE
MADGNDEVHANHAESTTEALPTARNGKGIGPARRNALIVAAVLTAFVVVLATRKGTSENIPNQLLGKQVNSFSGTSVTDGKPFDLAQQQGKFVVVNFFATWCPPCVKEHPELVAFASQYPEVPLVSVVIDSPEADVKTFFKKRGGSWPVLIDGRIPVDLGVRTAPETYIVDPEGRLIFQTNGQITKKALENAVANAVSRRQQAPR